MKPILPTLEHRTQPLLSRRRFALRLLHTGAIALLLVGGSLVAGMLGYRTLEGLAWIDAFLNASMLLGGMGPVTTPVTPEGKLFAGFYALYCGLTVIFAAGLILTPVAHRVLHKFHLEGRDKPG